MRSATKKAVGMPKNRWLLHLPMILVSIAMAVYLAQTDIIHSALTATNNGTSYMIASFIAGIFYATFFGVAPATIALIEIAHTGGSPIIIGILGGMGAVVGDLSLFQVIRFGIVDDIIASFQRRSQGGFKRLFKIPFFKAVLMALGAIILATPIPDEIGLTMLGIVKTNWRLVAIVGFACNAVGIFLIALIAQAVF